MIEFRCSMFCVDYYYVSNRMELDAVHMMFCVDYYYVSNRMELE